MAKKRRIVDSDEDEPSSSVSFFTCFVTDWFSCFIGVARALNYSVAGSSPPLTAASSPRSSHSPESKGKRKGKLVAVAETEKPDTNSVTAPEPSGDEGEEEVYNDELEDEDEGITAIGGAAASKTYVLDCHVHNLLLSYWPF